MEIRIRLGNDGWKLCLAGWLDAQVDMFGLIHRFGGIDMFGWADEWIWLGH